MADQGRRTDADRRKRIVIAGLVAFVVLFVVGAAVMAPWIERDLEDRGEPELAAAGYPGIELNFSGQDAEATCAAPLDNAGREEVVSILEDVWGIRVAELDDSCGTSATDAADDSSSDPGTGATSTAGDVVVSFASGTYVLNGTVPSEEVHQALVDAAIAALGGDTSKVIDRIVVDDTVTTDPAAYDAVAAAVSAMPTDLVSGSARLTTGVLHITGVAASADALAALTSIAEGAGGDADLTVAEAPAVVDGPANASLVDGVITLSGTVPSEEIHQALVAAATAAVGAENVVDNLVVDATVTTDPAAYDGLATVIAAMPANLLSGSADLSDGVLAASGTALSQDAAAAMRTVADGAGAADVELDVQQSTAGDVTVSLVDGVLTLTGTVPSEEIHQALLAAAQQVVDPANVIDQIVVDPAATTDPAAYDGLVALIGSMPPNLVSGEAGVRGGVPYLTGVVVSDEARAAITAAATDAGVPTDGLDLSDREAATADQAAALTQELNDLVAAEPILFDPGSANLSAASIATIDKVAAIAKRYAGTAIQIQGHTDADGSTDGNQRLSASRAAAVLNALVARGVPVEQLTSQGFGETQPIAPNDTPENKAKNRRVVFDVTVA